jgi:hypothetical protein
MVMKKRMAAFPVETRQCTDRTPCGAACRRPAGSSTLALPRRKREAIACRAGESEHTAVIGWPTCRPADRRAPYPRDVGSRM